MPAGEPTSVAVHGMIAYVGETRAPSYTEPSGLLHAIDVASQSFIGSCDLGGQPDSVAIGARRQSFIAVAIENET
jgi:hypothetical protein